MKHKLLWAFALLLIVVGILLFLTARYADKVVDPFVRSLLEQNKPMNHRIEYQKIRVNLISRQINIKNARIYPDTSLVKDENIWFEVNVALIKLTDFSIKDLLMNKKLIIGDLIFLKPDVSINLPINVKKETIDKVQSDSSKTKKSQALKGISLNRIMITGGTFKLIRNDAVLASTNQISLIAKDINLVKNSLDEPIGYTYGDVSVMLSNIKLRSETGLYDMNLEKFYLDKKDSSAHLEGLNMKPKYDKKEFTKKLDYQKERFDLSIGSINIDGIGYRRLFKGEPLEISKVVIDSINADIFKDKTITFDPNKFPLFFNESFLKLDLPVDIDTVAVTNSTLLYNELAEGRTEVGLIRLDDFNLQIYDLTTHPEDDTLVNVMQADIQANVMGEGPMNVRVTFPLEGNLRHVECAGSVGAMHLVPLNAFLEPSLNIKFNAGTVTRMTFVFSGDDNTTNGWMEFLYKNVDVVILKKEEKKESGFLSFLANTVTNSNNPETGKTRIKSVQIGVDRDKNKGPINYIWRTIQSGMIRTILPISKYNIDQKEKEKSSKETASGKQKKKKKKN